ncbi:MAG TPA: TIGR02757 family protein, partial [Chitinophagaceae bacterium]|nr:TIGR02757 family protein [Chitinophagaceae bacterium]
MDLAGFLNAKAKEYENPLFIEADPICIPHRFTKKQDIEIAGFFAAIFAWGNRTTIIRKSEELMALMGNSPHEFCLAHDPAGLKKLMEFKHRTFTATDILYFISFFHHHYSRYDSLESAFTRSMKRTDKTVESALAGFYHYVFSLDDVPKRTRKHIASP